MKASIRKDWLVIALVCLFALAYGAVEARRHLVRKQAWNDLKWIGIALHQYHDRYGCFPPVAELDHAGKPIHSWRALITSNLVGSVVTDDNFSRYDPSRPWDSTGNRNSEPKHRFGAGAYQFLAVVGSHSAWPETGTRRLSEFTDGTSESALVIGIRNSGVHWYEPVDAHVTDRIQLSVNGRTLDLASDIFVLTADGSVRFAKDGISGSNLAALLTIDCDDKVGDW